MSHIKLRWAKSSKASIRKSYLEKVKKIVNFLKNLI